MVAGNSQLDTTIEIVTPENIAFHYRVAGPFRRLPAYLIDLALRLLTLFVLQMILGAFAAFGTLFGASGITGLAIAMFMIWLFLLEWFYGGLFETFMNGQTPGKWVMGVRVLTVDGQPINGMQAMMRNFLRAADMFPMTYMVGLVTMAFNRRFQRLGDLVCGTMVVIEERHWLTGVAKLEDPRAAQLAEYVPADFRVSRSLAQTLATYVERRRFFTPARRREVARHLGEPLLEHFGMRKDTSHDLLLCALYYKTFIADRTADEERAQVVREASSAPAGNGNR
jgi:uncharacterized RDD family membrane protein YckC